ncbi:MAG: NCS2 family permease [Bdellovibrionota bacterium]
MRLRTEVIAGITTFFTMAYIVVVNPSILSTEGTGIPFAGALAATVLTAFTMTLFMGLYAKLPFAVAPGMGINAFFTFTVILTHKVPWPVALGMIFWAGVIFVLLSVTPVRLAIARAIPAGIRAAAAVGIGIFLTFIGLKNAGMIQGDPVTLVKLGALDGRAGIALVSLMVMTFLLQRKNPLAFLVGIGVATLSGYFSHFVQVPSHWVSWPDFGSVFLKLDIRGAARLVYLPTIVAILFTDLFDSISTLVGVSHATGLLDKKGEPLRLKEGLVVDAFATLGAALAGTSSGTAFIESSAGIEIGGRTGRTSVVTALCFLPCFFLAPLAGMVPAFATAPVLILVGALMFRSVKTIPLDHLEDAIPAFLTVVLIPLTFSITQGILWGFLSHVVLYWVSGRRKEVSLTLHVIAVVSVALLFLERSG